MAKSAARVRLLGPKTAYNLNLRDKLKIRFSAKASLKSSKETRSRQRSKAYSTYLSLKPKVQKVLTLLRRQKNNQRDH